MHALLPTAETSRTHTRERGLAHGETGGIGVKVDIGFRF